MFSGRGSSSLGGGGGEYQAFQGAYGFLGKGKAKGVQVDWQSRFSNGDFASDEDDVLARFGAASGSGHPRLDARRPVTPEGSIPDWSDYNYAWTCPECEATELGVNDICQSCNIGTKVSLYHAFA